MFKRLFATLDGAQKIAIISVGVLFALTCLMSILGYVYFQILFYTLAFFIIVHTSYRYITAPQTIRYHWLCVCLAAIFLVAADILWLFYSFILLASYDRYNFLNIAYIFPSLFVLFAISMFLYTKFKEMRAKAAIFALDSISIFLFIATMLFNAIRNFDINLIFTSADHFTSFANIIINSLIAIITLSILINAGLIKIRVSGFYLLVSALLFAVINLYIYAIPCCVYKSTNVLYLICALVFMIGSFKLKTSNEIIVPRKNSSTVISKILPIITIIPLMVYGDFTSLVSVFILFVVVSHSLVSYYIKNSIATNEILQRELKLHAELEKIMHDRTNEFILANLKLQDISERDYLTGLGSRNFLIKNLKTAIESIGKQDELVVYCININNFRSINTSYGHGIGDRVLKAFGRRLVDICDSNEFISRIGADEFIIFAKMGKNSKSECLKLANTIKDGVQEHIFIDKYHFRLNCTIGFYITDYTSRKIDVSTAIKNAYRAMCFAKQKPSLNPLEYDEKIDKTVHINLQMEALIQTNEFEKEFKVFYQPIFDVKNKKIIDAEALLRWDSKEHGFLEASAFLDIFKNTEILSKLCGLTFEKTIRQISRWQKANITLPKISINIAPSKIDKMDFAFSAKNVLEKYNVDPNSIQLELTETVWTNSTKTVDQIFTILKDTGIDVLIDDFGTGYSSLTYIKRYDIKGIKIAKDFILDLATSKADRQIVKTVMQLAKNMNIKVTAKGVESKEIYDELLKLECYEMQGYYIYRPMNAEEFEEFLRNNPQTITPA